MNVSLQIKKIFLRLLPALLWLGFSTGGIAQGGVTHLTYEIISGDSIDFTFEHANWVPPQIMMSSNNGNPPQHGTAYFDPSDPGWPWWFGIPGSGQNPSLNKVIYKPDPGFYGKDDFSVLYKEANPTNPFAPYTAYFHVEVTVLPSFLVAEDDFGTTNSGQAVTIDVLANDFTSASIVSVEVLPVDNYGTTTLNSDTTVTFTPNPGFSGIATFNYTACDNAGSCDLATVNIYVKETTPPASESLDIFTKKNESQVVLLALDGFSLLTPPTNGDLDSADILEYIPDTDYIGTDQFIYEDANQNQKIVNVEVLDAAEPNNFVFDDYAFMPVDGGEVYVNVLANDKGGNTLVGPYKVEDPEHGDWWYMGNGNYRYEPDPGFVGIDKFVYKASTVQGGTPEYGTGYVVVFDHEPELPVYQLITPKNTPLVINYNIPIEDFDFVNFSANPSYGYITDYPGQQTVSHAYGQEFSGYNMVVYTPDPDEVGVTDEFEFEYCVAGNNNCQVIKIIVDVIDLVNPPPVDSLCAGNDCVWTGDTNHDGIVDIRDLLPIGLCMGEVGTARPNPTLEWYGQYGDDWYNPFAALPMNVKHIDADGDGKVQAIDTTAISDFYYNRHTVTPKPFLGATDTLLFIEDIEFDPDTVEIGDVFLADISLGFPSSPAIDAYGVAFSLNYDPAIFEAKITFDNDEWLRYNSPVIGMTKEPFGGKLDAGYTRTSGVSASGYGIIGQVEFIVIDDLIGIRPSDNKTSITITPYGMMNSAGEIQHIAGNTMNIYLDNNVIEEEEERIVKDEDLMVYPNPASDHLTVHLNGYGNEIEQVVVYTLAGQEVYNSGAIQTKRSQLDVGHITPGIYVMKVLTNGGMLNKKIDIVR